MVVNSHNLNSVNQHLFTIENAYPGILDGFDMAFVAHETVVIAGNEVSSEWNRKLRPWFGQLIEIRGQAIVQIASDKNQIGSKPGQHDNDAPQESPASYMSQVRIAEKSCNSSPPRPRQIGQGHDCSFDTRPGGVNQTGYGG